MSTAPRYSIDPAAFWADPYPDLARMRAEAPILFVPELNATLFLRRDDIYACEKNIAVFSSDQPGGLMNVLMGQNMMRKDGEAHQAERRVFFPAVSPKAVREVWRAGFERETAAILDRLAPRGEADLVRDYALPVSGEALKLLTGLTNITFQEMDAWSQAMIDGIANYAGDPAVEARCHAATAAIDAAIDARLPAVEATPDSSLLSVMLRGGLSLAQTRANIKLAISGGQNEPRDAIAGCIYALLTHPEQLALIRDGRATWRAAFAEYCRWVAPIGMTPRRVAQAFDYAGVAFEPEERVFFMFGSANRDEAHFAEPDRFDLTRDTRASIPFGAGPHFCAGAAASHTLVAEVALPLAFERLRGLRLPEPEAVRFGGWAFRGPIALPAVWQG
ncbi:MAG: cytochrome P450 [Alphaproteobacteria bacterium]|nr:cytochrome P450 [Alphaproteobacteria bacterium]MCB9929603.1 cytochrome P450 [Alphaproteobacteria bacterium]